MTLQICFSGSQNQEGTEFILPTRHQERYMIYDAIVNGARGLISSAASTGTCQNERDRRLGWNWTFWRRRSRASSAEISARSPLHPALLRPETTVGSGRATTGEGRSVAGRQRETLGHRHPPWQMARQDHDPRPSLWAKTAGSSRAAGRPLRRRAA